MSLITGKWLEDDVVQEQPSGTVNGVNTSFTLSQSPNYNGSVLVFKNGLIQIKTTDFSVSGTSLTFVVAPPSGSAIYVVYTKE